MSDDNGAVYDSGIGMSRQRADAVDARMVELDLASPDEFRPGNERFYGAVRAPESYDADRVRDLGEMPDGSFGSPAEAIVAQRRELEQYDEYEATASEVADDDPECG
ncbi:MAG: hypothetical protein L0I76_12630 [Pseudonocardia sp.]|nr:hypothetical protein [Pseudonocardia sp.]